MEYLKKFKTSKSISIYNNKATLFNTDGKICLQFNTSNPNGTYCKKSFESGVYKILTVDYLDKQFVSTVDEVLNEITFDTVMFKGFEKFIHKSKNNVMHNFAILKNGFYLATDSFKVRFEEHSFNISEDIIIPKEIISFFKGTVVLKQYKNVTEVSDGFFTITYTNFRDFPYTDSVLKSDFSNSSIYFNTVEFKKAIKTLKNEVFCLEVKGSKASFDNITVDAFNNTSGLNFKIYLNTSSIRDYVNKAKDRNIKLSLNGSGYLTRLNYNFIIAANLIK